MSLQPEPNPEPEKLPPSDDSHRDPRDKRYAVSAAVEALCDVAFSAPLLLPREQRSSTIHHRYLEDNSPNLHAARVGPAVFFAHSQAETEHLVSIRALLHSGSPRTEPEQGDQYEVLAVGLPTRVQIAKTRDRKLIVPFVASKMPVIVDSQQHELAPARLQLGLFFPELGSYRLTPIGVDRSIVPGREYRDALVPALQWLSLVERSGAYSDKLHDQIIRASYGMLDRKALARVTGSEVLAELHTRALPNLDSSLARCMNFNLHVSLGDIYRGLGSGVCATSPTLDSFLSEREQLRQSRRLVSPHIEAVAALLRRTRWFGLVRETIASAQERNSNTLPVLKFLSKGLELLREISIGHGSPLEMLQEGVRELTDRVMKVSHQSSSSSPLDPKSFDPLHSMLSQCADSLEELERLRVSSGKKWGTDLLKILDCTERSEHTLLEVTLELRAFARRLAVEEDCDSAAEEMCKAYLCSTHTLAACRRTFDQHLPGLLMSEDAIRWQRHHR